MNIALTFLKMAGIQHPAPTFKDREVVGMREKSMVPWLQNKSHSIHQGQFVEGWEMTYRAAVRRGEGKTVYMPSTKKGSICESP